MFAGLVRKELGLIAKGITIYLFAAIVLLFYLTQYGNGAPLRAKKPLQPLTEMQFMYTKMLEDYRDCKLSNKKFVELNSVYLMMSNVPEEILERIKKADDYPLSDEDREALKKALEIMNPAALEKKENILKLRFHINEEEYDNLMKELDAALGGYTYYYDENAKGVLLSTENRYGSMAVTEPVEQMKAVYDTMSRTLNEGRVLKYRLHFEVHLHLNDKQRQLLQNTMNRMVPGGILDDEHPNFLISYDECFRLMKELDAELDTDIFVRTMEGTFIYREMTYEEAMEEFKKSEKEGLATIYARLLADYMGITAGFLPVFLSGFIPTRDYRSRMHELIYCRECPSHLYLASKFTAVVFAVMICYLGVALHSTFVFYKLAVTYEHSINSFAFIQNILTWVLPTVLFTTAAGIFFSVLFRSGIAAVVLQLVMWFASIAPLSGDYRLFKHIIRFNIVNSTGISSDWFSAIAVNRLFFTVLSFALIAAASVILSHRRASGNGSVWGHIENRLVQH